jgi:hypothetical protein
LDNCAFGHVPVPGCPGTSCACNPSSLDGGPDSSLNDAHCPDTLASSVFGTPCDTPGVRCTYGTGSLVCGALVDGGAASWNDARCPAGAPPGIGTSCDSVGGSCAYGSLVVSCLLPIDGGAAIWVGDTGRP